LTNGDTRRFSRLLDMGQMYATEKILLLNKLRR